MFENSININTLCYNALLLKKKMVEIIKIALLGPYLGKNRANMGHSQKDQNQIQMLFLEIIYGILGILKELRIIEAHHSLVTG